MSRLGVRIVLWGMLLTATLGGSVAAALGASSIQMLLDGGLPSSAIPALLGPITETGRTGWACKPEQAAAAKEWHAADLPAPSDP